MNVVYLRCNLVDSSITSNTKNLGYVPQIALNTKSCPFGLAMRDDLLGLKYVRAQKIGGMNKVKTRKVKPVNIVYLRITTVINAHKVLLKVFNRVIPFIFF